MQERSANPPYKTPTLEVVARRIQSRVHDDGLNEMRGNPSCPLWQRVFYDHFIRNDDELNKIREYIRTNRLS